MTENTPGGATPPPTGTPADDPAGHAAPPPYDSGPRVSADEVRDLARLRRSSYDRHVAGVAGGLARHLDIDPVIVRVAFVVLTFFGGAGLLVYLACWLVVPADDEPDAVIDLEPRTRNAVLIVVGVLAALATIGEAAGGSGFFWFPLPLLAVALVVFLLLSSRDRKRRREIWYGATPGHHGPPTAYGAGYGAPVPPPGTPGTSYAGPVPPQGTPRPPRGYVPPPPRPRNPRKRGPILLGWTIGLVAIALGTLGIVDAAGGDVADAAYPALALGVIAVMLLIGAFFGRAGGLIVLGLIAAVGVAGATITDHWDDELATHAPRSAATVDDEYWVDAGELRVNLSSVADVENLDGRRLEIGAGLGRVEIVVPDNVDVNVRAEVGGPGDISLFNRHEDGINIDQRAFSDGGPDAPQLEIDAFVGVGEIEVTRR